MVDKLKFSVMVVDDVEMNVDLLVEVLGSDYEVSVAMDGESAIRDIEENPPDLILLDIMMPVMDGYQVCEELKKRDKTKNIPIIFLTALSEEQNEVKGLRLGAVDYITKPFNAELVKARVRNHLELKRHQDHLEELVRERTKELMLTQEVTIESMGTLAEYRDPETGGHIKRTQNYVKMLAECLKDHPKFKDFFNHETSYLLYKSAPLHDIGKVGVPDSILLKPGKLTPEEFEEMKKHSLYGRDAILHAEKKLGMKSFLRYARVIAESHHEKWDGSGYPEGLIGDEISIPGRIMAIADVYDALISKRVYKPPYTHIKALEIIKEGRGSHFDPDIVDVVLKISDMFKEIAIEYADFEEERDTLMGKKK